MSQSILRIGRLSCKQARWQDVVAQCNAASLRILEREEREDPEQLCSFVFFSEEEWTAQP